MRSDFFTEKKNILNQLGDNMIDYIILGLVVLLIFLVAILIWIQLSKKSISIEDSEIESAFAKAMQELKLGESIGRISKVADTIEKNHIDLHEMLAHPQQRGSFGEIAMEKVLSDHLPKKMFGINKVILDKVKPDAHIDSTVGKICIDSKFPLENYNKYVKSKDESEKESLKKSFLANVEDKLEKISKDYIKPDLGTTDFAFAYIPSEPVFYFLISEAHDMLEAYNKKGVQVVSPLTFAYRLNLIKSGVHAKQLSDEAKNVERNLIKIGRKFKSIKEDWGVMFGHVKNSWSKAQDVEKELTDAEEEFKRISKNGDIESEEL